MAKVGVLLSGCGVQDGSEIHEAVLTLLALDEAGADVVCMAPDQPQARVVDHRTGKETGETRNVLVESARIARGKIKPLHEVSADDLDAIVLPGGYGAALNLCDFAVKGAESNVNPVVSKLLSAMHQQGKPIAAICIAPAVIAGALKNQSVTLTIGDDPSTASALEQMGSRHEHCSVGDVVIDEENRLITSPAYMKATRIRELREGIFKTVKELLRMTSLVGASR